MTTAKKSSDRAQIAPERRLRPAFVQSVELLTPHMKRVTVKMDDVEEFSVDSYGQWVKLFLPRRGDEKLVGRAYTICAFREETGELELDFVLHSHGALSTWAMSAQVNDRIDIAGPRSGFRIGEGTRHLLIGGDETALPAIRSIVEALPSTVKVDAFIEIPDIRDAQPIDTQSAISLTWLARSGSTVLPVDALSNAMINADFSDTESELWFAAEATPVRAVRKHYLADRKIHKSRVCLSGYWKKGVDDFRDDSE